MPYKTVILKSELELVDGLKKPDTAAFEELFDKYTPLVLTLVKELNVSNEKTEEVLLSCFVKISNHIHNFDPSKQRLFPWVLNKIKQTINEICPEEKQIHQIHNKVNYVKSNKDLLDPLLIRLFILHGGNIYELAALNGLTKQELMGLIRNNINQLKK